MRPAPPYAQNRRHERTASPSFAHHLEQRPLALCRIHRTLVDGLFVGAYPVPDFAGYEDELPVQQPVRKWLLGLRACAPVGPGLRTIKRFAKLGYTQPRLSRHDPQPLAPRQFNRARLDGRALLLIRFRQTCEHFAGRRLRDGRFNLSDPLPSSPMDIELTDVRGRGRIELVEKPWEGNGYKAVVLIEDERGGAADYSFDLVWRKR